MKHHGQHPSQTGPAEAARETPRVPRSHTKHSGPCQSFCLFGEVLKGGDAPAMRPGPSHPEVSFVGPAGEAPTEQGKEHSKEQRVDQWVEGLTPSLSHPPTPLNLQSAWSTGGTRTGPVQSEKLVRCLFRFQNPWKW